MGERIIEKEMKKKVEIGMHFVEELVFVVGLLICITVEGTLRDIWNCWKFFFSFISFTAFG